MIRDKIMQLFRRKSSRTIARERLKFIIIQDRTLLSPPLLTAMKEEMLDVINRYLNINRKHIKLSVERRNKKTVLEIVIPVEGIKKKNV